ncbi:MAG: hypothetical protein CK424_02145 [Legionella sp.]|nr:MAG: hypothetical protein CK424_02145 [Legionella sp.]
MIQPPRSLALPNNDDLNIVKKNSFKYNQPSLIPAMVMMNRFLYLLIMDPAAALNLSFEQYEEHEPGYAIPFLDAYIAAFKAPKTGKMSHLLIKTIHAIATSHLPNVQSGEYKNESSKFIIYGQRSNRGVNTRYSANKQGILDFIQYWMIENPKYGHVLSFENEKNQFGYALYNLNKQLNWSEYINGKRTLTPVNLADITTKLDELCFQFDYTCYINTMTVDIENNMIHPTVSRGMEAIFDEYHADISQASTNDQKISIILKHIQRIEQLHPFLDGNMRTCVILLNKLLHDHNIPLSLLVNPNRLDACDHKELVRMLKKGQETCSNLLALDEKADKFFIEDLEEMPQLQQIECSPHGLEHAELFEELLNLFQHTPSVATVGLFASPETAKKDAILDLFKARIARAPAINKAQSIIYQAISEENFGKALRNACAYSEFELIYDLVCYGKELGLDVNGTSSENKTALDYVPKNHPAIVRLLEDFGAVSAVTLTKPSI